MKDYPLLHSRATNKEEQIYEAFFKVYGTIYYQKRKAATPIDVGDFLVEIKLRCSTEIADNVELPLKRNTNNECL